jgi:diphosphoinositol-polyphosphate diphosphatase
VEVLLITSKGGKGWVFPKGGWEDDETVEAAAARETVEEAGVRGLLEEPLIGTYSFSSVKQERLHNVHQGRCTAHMFAMAVVEELDVWPEGRERERCWVSLSEAGSRCRHQWMRDALYAWCRRKGWHHIAEQCPPRADSSCSF